MKDLFKVFGFHLALVCIVILLLFTVTSVVLNGTTRHGEALTVPDITGLKAEDAIEILEAKKLKVLITDSLFFEDKPKNSVLDQNPSPQSKVKEGRIIYITINTTKPPLVSMPNLIDVSLRQAQVMLHGSGLKQGSIIYKPDIAQNVVLEQLSFQKNIVPGTKIPKGTVIDLVLGDGLGQGNIALPDLQGLTLEEARNILSSSALMVGSVVYQGSIKDSATAKVFKQHPEYEVGVMVGAGQPIDLFLKQE
jgi:eukaryotic-like serine/threonine-protein kinase